MLPAYMVKILARRKFDCNKCVGDVNEDVTRECIDIKKIVESAKEQDDNNQALKIHIKHLNMQIQELRVEAY